MKLNSSNLNDWLGVLTNIGLIAGLLLLAYEVRQTSEMMEYEERMRMTSTYEISYEIMGFRRWLAEDPDLTEIWLKGIQEESLTPIERKRYLIALEQFFRAHRGMFEIFNQRNPGSADGWAPRWLLLEVAGKPGLERGLKLILASPDSVFSDTYLMAIAKTLESDPLCVTVDPWYEFRQGVKEEDVRQLCEFLRTEKRTQTELGPA